MIKLDYIVAGTGRCGTLFMANYLTSSGIPCSHEAVFTPGGMHHANGVIHGHEKAVSSLISRGDNLSDYEMHIVADSSYMSVPFLGDFPEARIIHVVRNPKRVVSSFIGFGYFTKPFPVSLAHNPDHIGYERFMYENLPELTEDMPQLDRACLYWAGWNEMVERNGSVGHRHRIEDPTNGLDGFLGSAGTYSNKGCNSAKPGPPWSYSQIQRPDIRRRVKDLAKRYGYLSILD